MQNPIKINVTYTLNDLKEFVFAKSYPGTIGKMYYIILGFILPIAFTAIIIADVILNGDSSHLILIPSTIAAFIIFSLIIQAPFLLQYYAMKNNFKKSTLLNTPQCFELNENNLVMSSRNGSFSVLWEDVFRIRELKPCFILYTSPLKYSLIPRRCFNSQEQLEMFRDILRDKIDKKRLKFKKYPVGKINVDKDIQKYAETITDAQVPEEELPLFELSFSLAKEELLAANFRLYYTKPSGIIMTSLGFILLIGYIVPLLSNGSSTIVRLLVGLFFTVYPPSILYFRTQKGFEKDAALQKVFTYKFYKNFYIIISEVNEHKILWSDVVKTTEVKISFLIFVTKYIAHIIPKRAFEEDEEKIKMFKNIAGCKI